MLLHMLRPMARANLLRALASASKQRVQPKSTIPAKLIALQKKFQENNNLPVHLKGGAADKILYLTTMGLCGTGVVWILAYLVTSYIID